MGTRWETKTGIEIGSSTDKASARRAHKLDSKMAQTKGQQTGRSWDVQTEQEWDFQLYMSGPVKAPKSDW